MTAQQEGAFIRLLCRQWTSSELPCSLPNDDVALAKLSRMGDSWAVDGKFVKDQFEEVKGDPTRIRNPKLWAVYREALTKHRRRVSAGSLGGIAKANAKAKVKQSSSNATALPSIQNQNQSHTTTTTKTTTPAVAEYAFMASMKPIWKSAFGGSIPTGSAKLLKPSVAEFGEAEVARRLAVYCNATEGQYASIRRFTSTIATWADSKAKTNGQLSRDEDFKRRGWIA
jgi:hypothetical protein